MSESRRPPTPASADASNPFLATRRRADDAAVSDQDRNRLWWEAKPMTYAPWEAEDRLPTDVAAFREMERYLLAKSTYLRERFDVEALSGRRVLDLGCGSGVLACYMARHGAQVTGADITEHGTRLTAANAASRGLAVSVVRTDAEAMGFADASFDFVLSWGVLHHSRSTERALAEVRRVLRPGGRGLMMVYHRNSLVYYLKGLYWLLARGRIFSGETFVSVTDRYADGYYHRHFSRAELSRCLQDAGLTPERLVATQQEEPILPGLGVVLDAALKARFGWYLVAQFSRPAG
jgi:2-polyprenyl-3-methyl-5-hydroxy-6-metoxy-1,4-benzoquinol methylase